MYCKKVLFIIESGRFPDTLFAKVHWINIIKDNCTLIYNKIHNYYKSILEKCICSWSLLLCTCWFVLKDLFCEQTLLLTWLVYVQEKIIPLHALYQLYLINEYIIFSYKLTLCISVFCCLYWNKTQTSTRRKWIHQEWLFPADPTFFRSIHLSSHSHNNCSRI